MAAVLDALLPYVQQMLADMSTEELSMLLGVPGEIEKLGGNLQRLKAFVTDAERRRIDETLVQLWVSRLKDAMYQATDILELCQLNAEEQKGAAMEEKAMRCLDLRPLLFCLRNPAFAHSMGRRIMALNERLDEIRRSMAQFSVPLHPHEVLVAPSRATHPSRTTTSLVDDSAIVGYKMEVDTRRLVELLLSDNQQQQQDQVMVLSIVGAGGIGKTTLAKKIFNHEAIQTKFRKKIWLSITENYDEERLLSSAIHQVKGRPRGDQPNWDKQLLTLNLIDALSASPGKFLLVMDDVWSELPWTEALLEPTVAAVHREPGSRVIVTTRNEGVVTNMGAIFLHQHRVGPLNDKDAWFLLKIQLSPLVMDSKELDDAQHDGMDAIRRFDGLPLAIKAYGRLVRERRAASNGTEHWKDIFQRTASLTSENSELNHALLSLSYEDLPPHIKQCFLYYSLLPRGMPRHLVIRMWRSEGFLKVHSDEDITDAEEIGIDYHNNLIERNLIEPDYIKNEDGVHCLMQGAIRTFAQSMAKEEALVVGQGKIISSASSSKFRRVSIDSESSVVVEWESILGNQESLRSLIINGRISFDTGGGRNGDCSVSGFPSLRALYWAYAESNRFLESLGELRHLRFLHLYSTDVFKLPDDMGDKMKFLEHIQIDSCPNFCGRLPSTIRKLQRLRHLVIAGGTTFIVPTRGLCGLTNLRTLAAFPAQFDGKGWCSLEELGPLSQLVELELRELHRVPPGLLPGRARLRHKQKLRSLVLSCHDSERPNQTNAERAMKVFDELCPPPDLRSLRISTYLGLRPPRWMMASEMGGIEFFYRLRSLEMRKLPCCTDLPYGLWRLPRLERLTIDDAPAVRRVSQEFQPAGRSFPRMTSLNLEKLLEWEEWEWEEDDDAGIAMPALKTLVIISCKLPRLPAGLASTRRFALKELHLDDVPFLTELDNFRSVVVLDVRRCPALEIIRGFPKMESVKIYYCPALKVLEAGPGLHSMELFDREMLTLPEYLRCLRLRDLQVTCRKQLYDLLTSANYGFYHYERRGANFELSWCS
ncbi:hypothetical protein ACP70R_030844 [Stipagrostis hirtigluma subsp. patula]